MDLYVCQFVNTVELSSSRVRCMNKMHGVIKITYITHVCEWPCKDGGYKKPAEGIERNNIIQKMENK